MEGQALEDAEPPDIGSLGVERLRLRVRGAVQGVGFRPFVYRLARQLGLTGWVENSAQGVTVEVEGPPAILAEFRRRLLADKPPRASIQGLETTQLEPAGREAAFVVRTSDASGEPTALVLPDVATCLECLGEVLDPHNRRYRYAFTNCTNCGPRYSIILDLPYDRARTTMSRFPMCPRCRAEYDNPADRRFHAEPNACPDCGPRLELWDSKGQALARGDAALRAAAEEIRNGGIVAVKGLGGFHLIVDARCEQAVCELRRRKRREMKPLAVMVPSLADAHALCEISAAEGALLTSPEAPIVLLRRRDDRLAGSVAPGNPYLGVLLPYTPLHHLLLAELDGPVVATSGNVHDEPICNDEGQALEQLAGIADAFLVHDRPIVRPVDDSVARVIASRTQILRRARGYAPLPVCDSALPPLLAVGAHLKNSIAFSVGNQILLSPHIGDLETESAFGAFRDTIGALGRLYQANPAAVACDEHPDYVSTQYARRGSRPVLAIQHHYAHVLAGMADNELTAPVLGFAWDGSGYGQDATIWGGETLRVTAHGFERVAWMRPFPLPGGERAVREPRRSALGALYELHGARALDVDGRPASLFSAAERRILGVMLERHINAPITSSAGRLFDAVAALVGLQSRAAFEGQAAMALEFAMDGLRGDESYPFEIRAAAPHRCRGWILDWGGMLERIEADVHAGATAGSVSLRFHNTLVEMIVDVARRCGEAQIVLTGGCFQNRYLTERALERLQAAGFRPYCHQRIPTNDGGLAVGQILGAARALAQG